MIAEVISVMPSRIIIKVHALEDFKKAEELKVGSYLQIAESDISPIKLIAIINSFSIELNDNGDKSHLLEAHPLGIIQDDEFKRGGDSIALPPKHVSLAKAKDIQAIYSSNDKASGFSRFCFSKLAQNPSIEVPVNGNKFFNKHFAIVGSTGSGKSHTTAKILQSAIKEKNKDVTGLNNSHIILFDIHSEYASAFPKANLVGIEELVLPYWLLNGDELEELFLESGDNNNYNQSSLLRTIITENKIAHAHADKKVFF